MFFTASEEDIKSGKTTDFYFINTKKILEKKNINKNVVAEITASSLPIITGGGYYLDCMKPFCCLKDTI